jgi:hypothetical protein
MKRNKRSCTDPNQPELFAVLWMPYRHPARLCAGDVIRFDNRLCRVIRVNDCSAVIVMNRKFREFKTRFDRPVAFQPPPATFRISPNSEVEILNSKKRK